MEVEGIKTAHASLWASTIASHNVQEVVEDGIGRKIYCLGYVISTVARNAIGVPQIVSLTYKDAVLEVVDNDSMLFATSTHKMKMLMIGPIAALGTLASIIVAPIQLMQAHRAHKISRLESLCRVAQDAAQEDATNKIRSNSLVMAEAKESRQFKYANRCFDNNVFKFRQGSVSTPTTLAVIVRIDDSTGAIGTYNPVVYSIKILNNELKVVKFQDNICIDVKAECGLLKINRVMFSESGNLSLKPYNQRFSRDNKMEIIPCANMGFNSDREDTKVTAEQTKWAVVAGGEWTKIARKIGTLNRACCLEQHPDEKRIYKCATKWPAPILYAMMTMIYDTCGELLLALDDIGSLKIVGDNFNMINNAINSTLTYEIDGEMSSAWQVWTNGNYSLPVGKMEEF